MKNIGPILILFLILFAWSPWLSKDEATKLISDRTREKTIVHEAVCDFTLDSKSVHKVAFGYMGHVSYDCMLNGDSVTTGMNTVFLTFLRTIVNMPRPVIK